MTLLLAVGCFTTVIFIIYNLICYKNKKCVYTLNDKYVVLSTDYYTTQLSFGLYNSFLSLTFYLIWYIFSKNPFVFIFVTLIIFWELNYILELYSTKKGYIVTKKQH